MEGIILLFVSLLSVATLIASAVLYDRAYEPWWAVFIPVYTTYVLFRMVYGEGWRFLLLLIPFYSIYLEFKTWYLLARAFGRGTGFCIGTALFPPVFVCILAFSGAEYEGPVA